MKLVTDFLSWSGGDTPEHNIWDSNDKEDDSIPKVMYFCDGLGKNESKLIEDAHLEELSPKFKMRFDEIVKQIQSTWK